MPLLVRLVVISDLDAVVGVDARAAGNTQIVRAIAVVVEDHRKPLVRTIQNLPAQPLMAVELGVGLPSVDDPGLDLQLVGGEPLNAQAVEEPRRVGRHVRRLVGPVIEVVVAEQADVRHEDPRVDVQPMVHVEVIAAVGLRDISVSVAEVPLAHSGAGVVARRRGGEHVRTWSGSCRGRFASGSRRRR